MKKCKRLSAADRRVVFWGALILLFLIFALIGPHIVSHDPYAVELSMVTKPPSSEYIMGTDYLGRCIFCRLVHGAFRSVFSAILVVVISFVLGCLIGTLCGYFGGAFDSVIMRIVDSVQAFPSLIFTIAVAAMLGSGMLNCIIAMTAVGWTQYARLSRSQALTLKEKTFVKAAQISGASKINILVKTIFPNSLPQMIVAASMHIGSTILSFAGLSFLGLGTAPPYPEWGNMLNDGRETLQTAPWTVIFPGLAIMIVVMLMGMFGDSINEKMNPKNKLIKRVKGGGNEKE